MTTRQRHHETWQEANDGLDRRFVAAFAAKDMPALLSCFLDSPELVTVFYGTEMRGIGELRQVLESLFSLADRLTLNIDRITRVRTGDVVIGVGRATYVRTVRGEDETQSEVWTDVRRLSNGRWVYVLSHREVLPGS